VDSQLTGEIKDRLSAANKIVIASHVRPDGDAIGSLLGLPALHNVGKSVQMILAETAASFKYLEGSKHRKNQCNHDTFITVDCGFQTRGAF
jgi:phosphoesterase RecJ-like protein